MVRIATTARGAIPRMIACLPKIGAMPRKKAEANAAEIPASGFDQASKAFFSQRPHFS